MITDFDIPSVWRANIGLDLNFDIPALNSEGYYLGFDYIYSANQDALFWRDISCDATGAAPDGRPIYSCTGPEAIGLTNIDKGHSNIFTVKGSKDFDFGLGVFASYTHQDVTDGHSGTSSTASSNFSDIGTSDRNSATTSISNHQREHDFKLRLSYEKEFFEDFVTRFTLFGSRRSGQPFSYTYDFRDPSPFGIRRKIGRMTKVICSTCQQGRLIRTCSS